MILHCLAGLPRSGSTVLAAILNQHPALHVSSTSSLIGTLGGAVAAWERNPTVDAQGRDKADLFRILRSVAEAHYATVAKPVILDKGRAWAAPQIMETMGHVFGQPPRIVATVRRVPDCVASFARVAKPDDITEFVRTSGLIGHLRDAYIHLQAGYAASPENFCIIDYDDLLADPATQLARVEAHLGLEPHTYDLSAIDTTIVAEHDEAWGLPGLHTIGGTLERQHTDTARDILGDHYREFDQPRFWRPEAEPRSPDPLDLQLEAGLRGDFAKGQEIADHLATLRPNDPRAAFNRGWYALRKGDLQDGHRLLDRGREINVFGNPPPTGAPLWDGRKPQTVLLNLEGGLGDQIHGARFAREIAARGSRCVLACDPELAPLLSEVQGVSAVVAKSAAAAVYHEAWLPSMSAVLALGWEYRNINGSPYIPAPAREPSARKRIGLRWSGNPQFEHEQHRRFDPAALFDAVRSGDTDFISLQRDDGADEAPPWVERVPLNTWQDTRRAIASCDLIVSSCTSVAHLAGAMGVPTWLIVPVLPYYLWARPGDRTPYYPGHRLFRQTAHGDWTAPLATIRAALHDPQQRARA